MLNNKTFNLVDFFTPDFMKKYTTYETFDDFIKSINIPDFHISYPSIDIKQLDNFIKTNVPGFNTWAEFKKKAIEYYRENN